MSFSELITDFIDLDEFGEIATIGGAQVAGIFERQFVEIQDSDSMRPTFYCALDDVSGVVQGTAFSINSKNYSVIGVRPESPFCLLVLNDA